MPPAVGGIKRYRDPSVCLFVCLSHGAAALGYRHADCLQLSHVLTADKLQKHHDCFAFLK